MFIDAIGAAVRTKVKNSFYAIGFFYQVIKETFLFLFREKAVAFNVLKLQIYFTGFKALGIITFISLAIGAIINIQVATVLDKLGQGDLIYQVLIIVITRELGPILTAFIVIARSGTAIATEMGNMVADHQIEAYISIGIKPVSYLVVPRVLGVLISIILLTIYFNFVGLFGSFFLTQIIAETNLTDYGKNILAAITAQDILASFIKSFAFGVIISTVATFHGFQVKISSTEVPQVVIKAVGQGFVFCIIANVIITLLYYI